MNKQNVDEILQQGIHGPKEINPDERRKYLGTIRERIVAVLTKAQVYEKGTYTEIETLMKENGGAQVLLNGNMGYNNLAKYVKLAKKYKLPYKMVTNQEHDSDIGLVLAYDHAIDKENIEIVKKTLGEQSIKKTENKKGLFSFLGKMFHR
ncbi:Uncharacterized protein YueI [Bacillus sp. cl95]|nr:MULTISPECIES: YueI family protein [unclassified Bacillus (in: firmicutes)]SFB23434.1 Uncharacterized protein YueI [Bacillus sp. UNCCL13]SFQ87756.1 Uncharacterized protein YueI [Bacillus sp. cl95]